MKGSADADVCSWRIVTGTSLDTNVKFLITENGKVGINENSPYGEVDIASSVEDGSGTLAAHGIRLSHVGASDEEVIPITAGFLSQQDRVRAGIGFIAKTISGSDGSGGAIGFYTRNTADGNVLSRSDEKLRITEGGDLRLGLSSVANQTDSAHHIMTLTGKSGQTGAGAIAFRDPSANTDGFIFADSGNLFITADYSSATADSSIRFRVDGSTERVRITSDGKFGILGNGANTTIISNEIEWPTAAPFHLRYNSNTSASNNGSYCAYFDNLVGTSGDGGDIKQQKTWIGMAFHDSNSNNRPQVKFGAEVGERGDANTQLKEGSGNFVVYTATGNSSYDDNATEKFVVQYNGTATISGSTVTSDARLKTDITTLTGTLDKVKQLRGVEYLWNDVAIENRGMINRSDGGKQIGVIADEVKPIYPSLVEDNGLRGVDGTQYKQVAYEKLVPILLEAIKELAAKVEALEG